MKSISHPASRIVGIVAALGIVLPTLSAHALSVNPAVQDVVIAPGAVETRTITIENDESITQTYVVTIQKFIPKGEYGQQEFLEPSDTSGLPEWMFVDKPEVTLAPGRSTTLQVALRVPEQAQSGGHYAALFLSRKQSTDEQVAMLPRLGILFFVHVQGSVTERLNVSDFSVDASGPYDHLPVGFRTVVTNEGNVHLVPDGMITVRNVFGSTVAKIRLNPDQVRILPGSQRVLSAVWTKGAARSDEGFWNGLTQELSNFAIGPYVATLELDGRVSSQPIERMVSFSVWPWRTGLALLALFAALIFLFVAFKKFVIASATSKIKT